MVLNITHNTQLLIVLATNEHQTLQYMFSILSYKSVDLLDASQDDMLNVESFVKPCQKSSHSKQHGDHTVNFF